MIALRKIRINTVIHKTFDKSKKEDEILSQSDIDRCNTSDMKYLDQNNNGLIAELIKKNKSDF